MIGDRWRDRRRVRDAAADRDAEMFLTELRGNVDVAGRLDHEAGVQPTRPPDEEVRR